MHELTNNVFDCALVLEGGGYRGAFSAGIVNVLLEQGIYFDFVCGISAGSSNTVNYLSRDRERVHRSFTDLMNGRAIGVKPLLSGKGYINADYDYRGCIEDGSLPFDWEAFQANPARLAIQSFERDTGRTVVYGRSDMPEVGDMIDRVRASSTLPGLMKPIEINGQVMYDGGLGDGAGIPLPLAEQAGYEKFFVVATRPAGYRKEKEDERIQRLFGKAFSKYPYVRNAIFTRAERYNEQLDRLERLKEKGVAYVIRPDEMPIESTTHDPRKLEEAYQAGYDQGMRELPRWREFLFGDAEAGPQAQVPEADGKARGQDA